MFFNRKKKVEAKLDKDVCILICPIAAGMLGICLTTIGLLRVVISMKNINTFADDLLSLDALIFLIATLSSYFAMRKRHFFRIETLESIADISFIVGLSLMVVVCILITFSIT